MLHMSEFWAALAGVLVGGILSLTGVWWTLRRQDERDRKADERALRDRKFERLRAALLSVVDAAGALSRRTLMLNIALLIGQNEGNYQRFNELVGEPYPSTSAARASLLLESEDALAILGKLDELMHEDLAGYAMLMKAADDKNSVSREEFEVHFKALQEKADALTALARERLVELQTPVE
jgi:hypothetical protein